MAACGDVARDFNEAACVADLLHRYREFADGKSGQRNAGFISFVPR
jgi:hypothetical protein